MKQTFIFVIAAFLLAACGNEEEQLRERAAELCQYIPDHELLEKSKDFMTADFYAVLDTMFNHLPEHETMDHEWLYYFVTGNGGTMADYEVTGVELQDGAHAVATVKVRQKWEDGSFDENSDIEEHKLYMEKVDGQWLMSDFDGHKQDCIRHIEINRREQAVREAISDYLVKEIGKHYLQGQLCIPTLLIVAEEEEDTTQGRVWCDCWVDWYNVAGDTLKTVSGGNHSGCMTIQERDGKPVVTAFEQTEDGARFIPSAKRIFGHHFDVYQNMNSNRDVREAARKEQLCEYVKRYNLNVRYYQDFGWDAVELLGE
ncbi:MAG: hypothetical protein J6Z14_14470 [Prevotella sp.]|nr:hypothetical protein [Prevotella sp.]